MAYFRDFSHCNQYEPEINSIFHRNDYVVRNENITKEYYSTWDEEWDLTCYKF